MTGPENTPAAGESVLDTDFLHRLRAANITRDAEYRAKTNGEPLPILFRTTEFAGEAGELLNVVKKLERERLGWGGKRATREMLLEEFGGVVATLDLLAMTLGVDLAEATAAEFNAVTDRLALTTRLAAAPVASPVRTDADGELRKAAQAISVAAVRMPSPTEGAECAVPFELVRRLDVALSSTGLLGQHQALYDEWLAKALAVIEEERQCILDNDPSEFGAGYGRGYSDACSNVMAELAALPPEGETGPAVAVKPLKWDARYGYAARTETAFGWFTVLDLGEAVNGDPFKVDGPWALDEESDSYFATLDAAKIAIQADYDRRILASLTVSPSPSKRDQHQGETDVPCEKCQGNGEIVTDWDRYLHAHEGDVGDEAVADCPDCGGTGRLSPDPHPTADKREGDHG